MYKQARFWSKQAARQLQTDVKTFSHQNFPVIYLLFSYLSIWIDGKSIVWDSSFSID